MHIEGLFYQRVRGRAIRLVQNGKHLLVYFVCVVRMPSAPGASAHRSLLHMLDALAGVTQEEND